MIIIGLTGGICSGKSTISNIFASHDAFVLDADKLGHEAYKPGSKAFDDIVKQFGESILSADGLIDRKALGGIVFSDSNQMNKLQEIVWPEIRNLIVKNIQDVKVNKPDVKLIIVEAAILIEAKWNDLFDKIIVVTVNRDIAISRLTKRNNISIEDAEKRISSQITNEERIKYADYVIYNTGELKELSEKLVLRRTYKKKVLLLLGRRFDFSAELKDWCMIDGHFIVHSGHTRALVN